MLFRSRSGGAAELLRALEALNLDVVLLNQAPPGDALTPLVTHRLAERPVSLVGTPDRMTSAAGLADRLQEHPIILPTVDSSVRTGFDALADRLGVRPQIVAEVERTIARLKNEGLSIVLVEQNIKLTLDIADEVVIMNSGQVAFAGTSAEVRSRRDLIEQHLGVH